MVKSGTKRKIPMAKIQNKYSRSVCFTKRHGGLFSKAADLCLLTDAQIAILATPSTSNSNVSFFSFGHSSVDSVVSAYLDGKCPAPAPAPDREDVGICMRRKDLGLGFWWDDERLAKSEDPEELKVAIDSASKLLKDLKELRLGKAEENHQAAFVDDLKKNEMKKGDGTQQELDLTLNLQSTCAISENFCVSGNHNKSNQELDQTLDMLSTCAISDEKNKAISENCCIWDDNFKALDAGNMVGCSSSNQEMDLNQLIDFRGLFSENTHHQEELQDISESLVMKSQAVDDDWMVSENPYLFSDSCECDHHFIEGLTNIDAPWFDLDQFPICLTREN